MRRVIFYNLIALSSFFINAHAKSDRLGGATHIIFTVPSSTIRYARIINCDNPILNIRSRVTSIDLELDYHLECEKIRKIIFFAGTLDDVTGEYIEVKVKVNKTSLVVEDAYFSNQKTKKAIDNEYFKNNFY
jgi:hypothetical protein